MGRKAGGKQLDRWTGRSWDPPGTEVVNLSSGHPMSPQLQMNRELKRVKMLRTQLYMKCLHHQHGRGPGTEKSPSSRALGEGNGPKWWWGNSWSPS